MMMMIKEPPLPQLQPPFPSSLLIYLYVGHFLARWGARMWEFSVGLYMIDVWPDSLLLAALYGVVESASTVMMWEFSVGLYMIDVWPASLLLAALYGVVESASTVMFGPLIGQWVDKLPYVKVIQIWLLTQNLSFIVAGGSVIALLVYSDLTFTNFMAFVSLVVVINLSGALGMLSTVAGTILIEREWVVVMSEGHAPEYLTQMNSVIRRIDLICKLFAPVVTGFIISFVSLKASALALSIWNTLSVCLQYWLLMSVYNGIPSLRERNQKRVTRHSPMPEESPSTSQEQRSFLSNAENGSELSKTNGKWTISRWFSKSPYISAWRVYLQQDVVLPGVALALLYFTVLSFGTLMTATLEWEGIPAYVIGIARGVSATIGIGATFLYPILQSRISTLRTGIWSIWSQWTCLLVCIASIWVQNNLVSAYMLMGGVAASRLGLWMFDLSVVQQMQDQVPESDRIVVGGVQNSIQSVLDLMTYVMCVIISNPQVIILGIISKSSSSNYSSSAETLDLSYEALKCDCGVRAAIRVTESDKPSKGRLYFICEKRNCQLWRWCTPKFVTMVERLRNERMLDQNQNMETVGLKVKNQMLEQSNAFMKQLVRYPDAAKYRRMPLQFTEDLDILFSDAAATGEWLYTPSSGVTLEEFHTPHDAEFHDDADLEVVHPSDLNKKGLSNNDGSSNKSRTKKKFSKCLAKLQSIPDVSLDYELYVWATRLFLRDKRHECFMTLPTDEVRLRFLKLKIEMEKTTTGYRG
ncbi:hypothetical protein TEA_026155 [Camellia sinensis var. sinensis]|uniref:GRF-type domain-containing protein n=1 Tax=Camellia sinensis var. sinensis TaxID=542762 RepID=A0A4S4DJP5_CAMSN|nr:hypothetical protein TEA_026155 [Camellia sinensis var. sinensis]